MLKEYLIVISILCCWIRIDGRSNKDTLCSRQVHLDFHTSEYISDIGEKFDKRQFQDALKTGHVNQINVFAKCCHSWSYYPTQVGKIHPNLRFDLLGAEIEACHEIGVRCPIYYTVGWSTNDALTHPDWCARNIDGSCIGVNYDCSANDTSPKPFNSWLTLCWMPDGPYHQHILQQVEELCQKYDVDGFFFDMYHILPRCYCNYCLSRYKKEGIDIDDATAVEKSMAVASKKHMSDLRGLIAKYHPNATVYFNATSLINPSSVFKEQLYKLNTQQELEDLPTTWGGYDKLPLGAKFHLGNHDKVVAMSGKFHKAWGEFGGYKHPDAMKYEAAAMISFGAACNFGDQLHPSGEMDMSTYRNLGKAYEYVEKIEAYGIGGIPASRLGLWLSLQPAADYGMVNILLETHYDFVIANEDNLEQLELLIIPSQTVLSGQQVEIVNEWIKKGGKLIVFGEGALDKERKRFILDVGVDYLKKSDFQFDYTVAEQDLGKNIVASPFLNYESGLLVKPTAGTTLASIREPYFNRTYATYCGHRETPYKPENSQYPAVVKNGNVIFFAHNLDQLYYIHALRIHRELVKNAIDLLYLSPNLKVINLPSCGRVSFLKQEERKRYVAHLLYAPALQRGKVQVIEDFLPVPGVEIEVNVPEKIESVYQIPGNKKLRFTQTGNTVKINVPTFTMHTGVVLGY